MPKEKRPSDLSTDAINSISRQDGNILSKDHYFIENTFLDANEKDYQNTQSNGAISEHGKEPLSQVNYSAVTQCEEEAYIKLLSEDDEAVNTDEDSDVIPVPVETQDLEMVNGIPPIIKNLSRSADIRKSRSLSPSNDTCCMSS